MTFWILTIGLGLVCAGILALTLWRGRVGDAPPAAYDLQVYRDQLKEVERDRARGVLTEDEAERVRAEVSRRILAADAQLQKTGATGATPALPGKLAGLAATIAVVGGAAAMYTYVGAPGYQDFPRAARLAAIEEARQNRLSQAEIESRIAEAEATAAADPNLPNLDAPQIDPNYLELMEKLRAAVAQRPDDLQGYLLLARNEAALGNLAAAQAAQARVIDLKGDAATAADFAERADLMVSAAGGYVSSDAEDVIRAALSRNPTEPRARYYMGLYLIQVDRLDAAFRTWDTLLRESTADAPWVPLIRSQIEELAWRAGIPRYEMPPLSDAPGPSEDDMMAAREMTPDQRAEMIEGMVNRLATRIEETGGTVEEWARLSNAYAVLGDFDAVRDLLARAPARFEDPLDVELVENAAKQAGFSE